MARIALAIGAAFIVLAGPGSIAGAQDYPPPRGFVSDSAHLLSGEAVNELTARLDRLERDTSAEVAVVTIETLGGHPIEEYAAGLFERWGIGKKDKDNGVLFLVAYDESELRIEVGYGLESVITDGRA